MKKILFTLSLLLIGGLAFTQDARLAQQYYRDGEYEKAAALFDKLFKQNQRNDYYFDRYINCLVQLEDYSTAETSIKKQMKKRPNDIQLYVSYGNVLEKQFKHDEADVEYQKAIKRLAGDKFYITKLASAFTQKTKYDLAIEVYTKGEDLLKDSNLFAYNLAELYRRKNEVPNMIGEYLNSIDQNPTRINTIQTMLQRYLPEEGYKELQSQLYQRIQDEPDAIHFPEMLSWVFIQRKEYGKALRQVRALDKKLNENGGRVYQLAEIAANDKDYNAAIDAYSYIVEQKGQTSTFYLDAKRELLRNQRNKLVEGFDYTKEDLAELRTEYDTFLDEFGRSKVTAPIMLEYAELEAFYMNDLDKATKLLAELVEFPGNNREVLANAKLRLADFYLMQGERWEATLLYSQVDKEFKDDLLGHEARYRNARLSYYAGDFQWAQAQFDVLKTSTSKLIANDALDMSVFIMDNMGLDTTTVPLEMYAAADLLIFQNRFTEAFEKLDSLDRFYPQHGLKDDILYSRSQVYRQQRDYVTTAKLLETIVENHPDEIRADNALFELAELYSTHLNDIEKAKELYETLFIDFSGSTFAVEARKRYRILRGDNI